MTRLSIVSSVAVIFVAGGTPLSAQRADKCDSGGLFDIDHGVREGVLRGAGYSSAEASLISALTDLDPSVRSFAADELASHKEKRLISLLMHAWSTEQDNCTRAHVGFALQPLLQLHWSLLPETNASGIAERMCMPVANPVVALELEQFTPPSGWTYQGPTLKITPRNLTSESVPYLGGVSPRLLYSYRVTGPNGEALRPLAGIDCPDRDCSPGRGPVLSSGPIISPHDTKPGSFLALKPGEETYWFWQVGNEFDMSAPGVYRVSLGAKLEYLNTTVCSNVAAVTVK